MRWLLLIGLLALSLVSCQKMSEEPVFAVTVAKEGDVVETAVTDDTVVFDVYSELGIGSAEVNLVSGEWPETILFRMHLSGLEDFKFFYGSNSVWLSASSTDGYVVQERAKNDGQAQAVAEGSPYYMPVRIESESGDEIPLKNGYFEVEPPADFRAGAYDAFSLNWIDFYR